MATLYEHMLARCPQDNNGHQNSTSFYLGGNEVLPEILPLITSHLSERTLFLLELASRNLGGYIGKLHFEQFIKSLLSIT